MQIRKLRFVRELMLDGQLEPIREDAGTFLVHYDEFYFQTDEHGRSLPDGLMLQYYGDDTEPGVALAIPVDDPEVRRVGENIRMHLSN